MKPTAQYSYKDNTFVLCECNKSFEERQKQSFEEMLGRSLLELFELPVALFLADAFFDVHTTGIKKKLHIKTKPYCYVSRLGNGDILINYSE